MAKRSTDFRCGRLDYSCYWAFGRMLSKFVPFSLQPGCCVERKIYFKTAGWFHQTLGGAPVLFLGLPNYLLHCNVSANAICDHKRSRLQQGSDNSYTNTNRLEC